jgi:hypothetical protein
MNIQRHDYNTLDIGKKKGKAIPVTGCEGP